jgi:hypothetical protein
MNVIYSEKTNDIYNAYLGLSDPFIEAILPAATQKKFFLVSIIFYNELPHFDAVEILARKAS